MMPALTYAQIEAATKEGPEAVAALLHAAGVELAGLPKELRRKLRGAPAEEPESPPAKDESAPAEEPPAKDENAPIQRATLLGTPPAKDPPPAPTGVKREPPPGR